MRWLGPVLRRLRSGWHTQSMPSPKADPAEKDAVVDDTDDQVDLDGAMGDAPIGSIKEDRLGRRPFAEALAAEITAAPADRGYVMGLTGPWGSGKTSLLNMAVEALGDDALVVQFNPWMFSGTEALVSSFFEEIGKQLNKKDSTLRGIAEKLATYGHLLSPLASVIGAGTAFNGAADVLHVDFGRFPPKWVHGMIRNECTDSTETPVRLRRNPQG